MDKRGLDRLLTRIAHEILEKNKSVNQILITTSTTSSARVFDKFKFKKTIHQFYPIDHMLFSNKFLDYWRPNVAIFLESEIWPSMFKSIKDKNIFLILLNAGLKRYFYL